MRTTRRIMQAMSRALFAIVLCVGVLIAVASPPGQDLRASILYLMAALLVWGIAALGLMGAAPR